MTNRRNCDEERKSNCSLRLDFPSVISVSFKAPNHHKPLVLKSYSFKAPLSLSVVTTSPQTGPCWVTFLPRSFNTIKVYDKLVTSEGSLAESLIARVSTGQRSLAWSTLANKIHQNKMLWFLPWHGWPRAILPQHSNNTIRCSTAVISHKNMKNSQLNYWKTIFKAQRVKMWRFHCDHYNKTEKWVKKCDIILVHVQIKSKQVTSCSHRKTTCR